VIVDVDDWLPLCAVVEEATKNRASGHPLASRGEVVELLVSAWDLDDHMLSALGLSPSGIERIVESGQDLGVAASVDIWANGEHTGRTAGSPYVMTALSPERLIVTSASVVM